MYDVYLCLMLRILKHLFPLFVVQFFTWLALFSLWIYATPVFTHYLFKSTDSESPAFQKGVIWVGIYFAFYSCLAACLAFSIPRLLKYTSKERLHAFALLIGAIGLLLIYFIRDQYLMFLSFFFIGIAWSSISTLTYRIVGDAAPENKEVMYFSVFNFSVVIPQVTAAFLLGYINENYFNGKTINIILLGACSMFLAGLIMFLLKPNSPAEEKSK